MSAFVAFVFRAESFHRPGQLLLNRIDSQLQSLLKQAGASFADGLSNEFFASRNQLTRRRVVDALDDLVKSVLDVLKGGRMAS